jgi:predicted nucleic acid-binding protein
MNGAKFLLDTNAVLYLLNGDETLADFLFEKQLYISIITEMELLAYKNITVKEQKLIAAFLNEMTVININNDIKIATIELKKNTNLKLPDSVIAATSLWLKIPFVTSDKQFKSIGSLNLVFYEK